MSFKFHEADVRTARSMKSNPASGGSIWAEVVARGIPYDTHESDLYIPVNDETRALVRGSGRSYTVFFSSMDHKMWYDIPFAYEPWWEKRTGRRNPGTAGRTTKTVKKIFKIVAKRMADEEPDLSHLGEYSNVPEAHAVDREERGDMGRNEYRYFNPANFDPKHPEYSIQDYERAEAFNKGNWYMLGIRADAEVGVSFDGGKSWKLDDLTSGGLWGIESDSDDAYFKEVEGEQISELRDVLKAYGFDSKQISAAMRKIERLGE